MSNQPPKFVRMCAWQRLLTVILTTSLIGANFSISTVEAQVTASCQLTEEAKQEKESLLRSSLQGDRAAGDRYKELLARHSESLGQCRSRTWPQIQAIWLRLYPVIVILGYSTTLWIGL